MTNKNLYWTAIGVSENPYHDGFVNKYVSVTGYSFESEISNEFPMFYYKDEKNSHIVLIDCGIALSSAKTLEDAKLRLSKMISNFGLNKIKSLINDKIKNSPLIPTLSPSYDGEIKEVNSISIKTGKRSNCAFNI